MSFPGPEVLGRGVVISPADPVPSGFTDAPQVDITPGVLDDASAAIRELHRCWARRIRVVVRLHVAQAALVEPESDHRPPWELGPAFEFALERLKHLVWMNNYDLRGHRPIWWHAEKAKALGLTPGGHRDAMTPTGSAVWIDGGPRQTESAPKDLIHVETLELRGCEPPQGSGDRPSGVWLAPDQQLAVAHPGGAARIIAPAGSGKTRVLTERIRHLVAVAGVEPDLVTAVAYNKRAADEMQERAEGLGVTIRTVHSLGLSILNRSQRREVIEERKARDLLTELVPVRHRLNEDVLAPYLEALAAIRIGLRDPAEVEEERDDVPDLPRVFEAYRTRLEAEGLVDFDEQIYGAIETLLGDSQARAAARCGARHLLVDEFQDLTPAFLLLLRLVAGPAYQVFGVGDDDQVIYGYAGANPGYLIGFEDLFPGAVEYELEVNYRCSPAVVDAANLLLGHSRTRIPKATRPQRNRLPADGDLQVLTTDQAGPGSTALEQVRAWLQEGVEPHEMAVLARVNSALLPVHAALIADDLPIQSTIGRELLNRTGLRTALAYLRIGLKPDAMRSHDLMETVRRPSRRLAGELRRRVYARRTWPRKDLRDLRDDMSTAQAERLLGYLDDLAAVTAATEAGDLPSVFRFIRDEMKLGSTVQLLDGSRSTADRSSHLDDLEALIETAQIHPDPSTFEQWLTDILRTPSQPAGVTLSSVHRVKGREWPRVIVFRADEGLMPHQLTDDIEEERRVFHVAITRGSDRVVVMTGDRPSRFVDEMAGRTPAVTVEVKTAIDRRIPRGRPSEPPTSERRAVDPNAALRVGSSVSWRGYSGIVIEVSDEETIARIDTGAVIRIPRGEPIHVTKAAPPPATEEKVFEALRRWRLEVAQEEDVPAFVVLHDKHLRGIAQRQPATMAQLATCEGIGPTKLDRYGDDILRVIREVTGEGG